MNWKVYYKRPSDPMWTNCIGPLSPREKDRKLTELQTKGYQVKPEYCGPYAWFPSKKMRAV